MTGRMIFSIFAKLRKLYFQRGLSLNSKHFERLIFFNLIPRDMVKADHLRNIQGKA